MQLKDIPVLMEGPGTLMLRQSNLGQMDVTYIELPKGTDFTPLLKGLANDCCHCPHWGYIIQGVFRISYKDGAEDILKAGDAFYVPPGHTAFVDEDLKCIMFSPDKEHGDVLTHAMNNLEKRSD
jgi:hypothetical protein